MMEQLRSTIYKIGVIGHRIDSLPLMQQSVLAVGLFGYLFVLKPYASDVLLLVSGALLVVLLRVRYRLLFLAALMSLSIVALATIVPGESEAWSNASDRSSVILFLMLLLGTLAIGISKSSGVSDAPQVPSQEKVQKQHAPVSKTLELNLVHVPVQHTTHQSAPSVQHAHRQRPKFKKPIQPMGHPPQKLVRPTKGLIQDIAPQKKDL